MQGYFSAAISQSFFINFLRTLIKADCAIGLDVGQVYDMLVQKLANFRDGDFYMFLTFRA